MKKNILTLAILFVLFSCDRDESVLQNSYEIQFKLTSTSQAKTSKVSEPKKILVTLLDPFGNILANRNELELIRFGDDFLSAPFTIHTTYKGHYSLSEFLVIGENDGIVYASPKEGSNLANQVIDPLDIEFLILPDSVTMIVPEVIAVNENSNPEDYGYSKFGFHPVKTVGLIFSSFVKLDSGMEPTACSLTIEGLSGVEASDTLVMWTHHSELSEEVSTIVLKHAYRYRITASKQGFKTWTANVAPVPNEHINILFESTPAETVDVYISGYEYEGSSTRAVYWKNGIRMELSHKSSKATFISVNKGDVYVAGIESGTNQPFYWKNNEQVFLPSLNDLPGRVEAVYALGNDIHVVGSGYDTYPGKSTPIYWKNGTLYRLPVSDVLKHRDGWAQDIAFVGSDIYICGNEAMPVIWKNGERQELVLPEPKSQYRLYSKVVDIETEGGNIYVYGVTAPVPVDVFNPSQTNGAVRRSGYWKNNELTHLREALMLDDEYEIDIVDDDFYSTDWKGILYPHHPFPIPTSSYWKSNEETVVEAGFNTNVRCIKIVDGIVYLAGDFRKKPTGVPSVATYWVNGIRFSCSENRSYALSMFVDKK